MFLIINFIKFKYFKSSNPNDYVVSVGIYNIIHPERWSKTQLKISKVIKHESYNDTTYQNDIGLIKLIVIF